MGVKMNLTSYFRENCSEHHNMELKTWKHLIEQNEHENLTVGTFTKFNGVYAIIIVTIFSLLVIYIADREIKGAG